LIQKRHFADPIQCHFDGSITHPSKLEMCRLISENFYPNPQHLKSVKKNFRKIEFSENRKLAVGSTSWIFESNVAAMFA